MRYQIEASVQGEPQVVEECDDYRQAVVLAKLSCIEYGSPVKIRQTGYHSSTVVYYGADIGETIEAAVAEYRR